MYASLGTRPATSFAVQTMPCFLTRNPGWDHWEAIKLIFRYLKGSNDLWSSYGGSRGDLTGCADATGGSMAEGRHTVSGHTPLLCGGAVSWS
jgi:hypothetical protein